MGRSEQGVDAAAQRYTAIPRVLVFVFRDDEVLLLKGAPTRRIWPGRYNGIGGHVEAKEDVYTAARREVMEESGIEVRDLRLRGVINIDVARPTGVMLFVFTACAADDRVCPSAEGTPEWVSRQRIKDLEVVEDLPVLLERIATMDDHTSPFFARYSYDEAGRLQIAFAEQV